MLTCTGMIWCLASSTSTGYTCISTYGHKGASPGRPLVADSRDAQHIGSSVVVKDGGQTLRQEFRLCCPYLSRTWEWLLQYWCWYVSSVTVVVVSCIRHTCEYGCPQITVERGLSTHCPRIMRLTAAAEVLINFSVTHSSVELVREDDGREIACGMEACTRWQMMFGKLVNAG